MERNAATNRHRCTRINSDSTDLAVFICPLSIKCGIFLQGYSIPAIATKNKKKKSSRKSSGIWNWNSFRRALILMDTNRQPNENFHPITSLLNEMCLFMCQGAYGNGYTMTNRILGNVFLSSCRFFTVWYNTINLRHAATQLLSPKVYEHGPYKCSAYLAHS